MQAPRYVENNLLLVLKREQQLKKHKLSLNSQRPDSILSRKTTLPQIAHLNYLNQLKIQTKKSRQTSTHRQIQAENKKIVIKLAEISHRDSLHNPKMQSRASSNSSSRSLNQSFMKNKMKEIQNQNISNTRRLEKVRSNLQLRKHEEQVYTRQAEYKRNICHYSSKSQQRFKSLLSKLNISSLNRSFSLDGSRQNSLNQNSIMNLPSTKSKEYSSQVSKFSSRLQNNSKFDNSNSISVLAANLARIRIGGNKLNGSIQKMKLPPI